MTSPFRLSRRLPFGMVAPLIETITGLKTLNKLYLQQYKPTNDPADFAQQALNILDVNYVIEQGCKENIPQKGPLIIVANHPFGGVEGLVLIDMIIKRRPDIKILTNQELNVLKGLNNIFIGVNILGESSRKKKNWLALHEAQNWINAGGALLLFPSGEVASWQWKQKQVIEAPWQKTIARLTKTTKASVIPVFFEGKNSSFFHSLGIIHKRARTIWLARELINKQGLKISLRIGEIITQKEIAPLKDKATITNYLRLNTLLLGCQQSKEKLYNKKKYRTSANQQSVAYPPINQADMIKELSRLNKDQLLLEKHDMQIWCASSNSIPNLLLEIGRLREITFRAVGEGSGNTIDTDEYDSYYHHLFLWNTTNKEIVGAYRIGRTDDIISEKGLHALYSQQLFGYDQSFLDTLSPCLEMGRSFIRQEYQRNLNGLLLLWKGIGAYIARHPHYRVLFGPVSISNNYSEISRQLIASCLTINNFDQTLASMIKPVKPYKLTRKVPWTTENLYGIKQSELLSSLIKIIEGDKGIPTLLKQYLKLNGEFVGFNLDPDFANALDGLIIVDINRVDHRILNKYMGLEQAQKYRDYQKMVQHQSYTKKETIVA